MLCVTANWVILLYQRTFLLCLHTMLKTTLRSSSSVFILCVGTKRMMIFFTEKLVFSSSLFLLFLVSSSHDENFSFKYCEHFREELHKWIYLFIFFLKSALWKCVCHLTKRTQTFMSQLGWMWHIEKRLITSQKGFYFITCCSECKSFQFTADDDSSLYSLFTMDSNCFFIYRFMCGQSDSDSPINHN